MIIILEKEIDKKVEQNLKLELSRYNFHVNEWLSDGYKVLGIMDEDITVSQDELLAFPGVKQVISLKKPYKKVLNTLPEPEIVVKNNKISRSTFSLIAGPCTIESYEELSQIVKQLKTMGIKMFRGGTYKMRTSPYSFQGLGLEGLKIIKRVSEETDMISVSEVVSVEDVEIVAEHVDILVVGTRNMYNYRLLKALGKIDNPIILKRSMSGTIEEWLLAAEYIAESGNEKIVLCERGIRTFERYTRNTLDISAIPAVKMLSNLPIIVDPSHSTGRREMILSMSWAAMAAGADGLLIETHFAPDKSLVDSQQTIDLSVLRQIVSQKDNLIGLWGKV